MTRIAKDLRNALFVACALSLLGPAAALGADSPLAALKAHDGKIKKTLASVGKTVPEARKTEVKDVINGMFDFEELTRRALRDHWKSIEAPKRQEFVTLLRDLIRDASINKLSIYRSEVAWEEESVKAKEASVTSLVEDDDEEIEVIYKLHQTPTGWRVYDMVIDDLSTVEDYRISFNKEIAKNGFDSLLQKLRDKKVGDKKGQK